MTVRDPFDFSAGDRPSAPPPPSAPRRSVAGAGPRGAVAPRVSLLWLGLGIATAATAAAVALWFGAVAPIAIVCWVLAGPVAIGLLAVHVLRATAVRAGPTAWTEPRAAVPLYWTALAVSAIGIGISAWRIADWAGRL
jgi:hypothetical protein